MRHPYVDVTPTRSRCGQATAACVTRWRQGLLLIGLLACSASLAEERIERFRIAGGGGTSSSGAWSLSGTVGQGEADVVSLCSSDGPDPGLCEGASFELTGGFWAGRVQLATAPHPACGDAVGCLFRDGFEAAD